jgi:hypothetical protein
LSQAFLDVLTSFKMDSEFLSGHRPFQDHGASIFRNWWSV